MQIVTGYEGQAHITSNDDQGRNQGTFGEASYVLSVGSKFAPTLLSANSLKIADGEGVHQGVHFRVDPGTYDTVTIDNGEQGKNRKDLVVCRYTKDGGTGIESCEWVVIKGTASSGTATRPSHITGDILNGSLVVDMPFFEVSLSGINVSAVTTLFVTLKTMGVMQTDISTNTYDINTLNSKAITNLGTSIPSGANLNDYTTPGRYYATSTASMVNLPVTGSSLTTLDLIVMPRSSNVRVFQIAYVYAPTSSYAYIRVMSGASQWSSWDELTNSNLVSYLDSKLITNAGASIGNSDDLNTYITPGKYYASDTTSISNLPITGSNAIPVDLIVIPRGGSAIRVYQIALIYSSQTPFIYVRVMVGDNSWSAWKEMTNQV